MVVLNDKKKQEIAKITDGKDYHSPDKGLFFNIVQCWFVWHLQVMGLLLPKGDISSKWNSSNYKIFFFFLTIRLMENFLCFSSLLPAIVPCVHVHHLFIPLVFTSLWHVLFTPNLSVQNTSQMFKKDPYSDYITP